MDWYLYGIGQNWLMPAFSLFDFRFDMINPFADNIMPIWNFHHDINFDHNTNYLWDFNNNDYYDTPIYENMGLTLSTQKTSTHREKASRPKTTTEHKSEKVNPQPHNNNSTQLGNNIANTAKKYLGYKESDNSYKKFTHGRAEAWCADFVSYVARECGLTHIDSPSVSGLLKCGTFSNKPKVGDAIIFRKFDKNNKEFLSHTGIVTRIENGRVYTIEGNLSDKVAESNYDINDSYIKGYVTLA